MRIPYVDLKQQYIKERKNLLKIIDRALKKDKWVGGDEVEKFEKKYLKFVKQNTVLL